MAKLAVIKTRETDSSVSDYINGLQNEQQRADSFKLVDMMQKATKEKPKMWGSSIIGFGLKRYKSPNTGREVDWFKIGFSPRKANISLHLVLNIQTHATLLEKLGKHKAGVGCLYIQSLENIDIKILEQLIQQALKDK